MTQPPDDMPEESPTDRVQRIANARLHMAAETLRVAVNWLDQHGQEGKAGELRFMEARVRQLMSGGY